MSALDLGRTHRRAHAGDALIDELNLLSFRRIFNGLFHFPDADGKIRAVQLAPPATGAPFGFLHHRGTLGIQAEALPRAESRADAAGLAPVPR